MADAAQRCLAALLCALLCVVAGCDRGNGPSGGGPPKAETAPAAVPVEVDRIVTGDMERTVSGSTTLRSAVEVALVSEIAGRATQVLVEVGDTVTAGQIIARIENEDIEIAIREARHNVERLERELSSMQPLQERGYLSRQAWEELEFQRDQARTQLARVERQRGQQTVRATRAGLVIARSVEVGAVVVPNQTLVQIADPMTLEARIAVPEREMAALREGQAAQVTVDALGGRTARAVVDRLDPVVDPQSGTIGVRVTLAADALAAEAPELPLLRPGMFVTVRVTTDVRAAVPVVPKRAVLFEADEAFVFRVVTRDAPVPTEGSGAADGSGAVAGPVTVAERVQLRTGYENATHLEILSGLAPGDEVIVAGQNGMADGTPVRVTRGRAEGGGSSAAVAPGETQTPEGSASTSTATP